MAIYQMHTLIIMCHRAAVIAGKMEPGMAMLIAMTNLLGPEVEQANVFYWTIHCNG